MLFHTTYLPPISIFQNIVSEEGPIYIEGHETYQKRSYRNRTYISSANKIICLSIPLIAGKNSNLLIQSVEISYEENWIKNHIDSIYAAYGKSAFFIHYIDELEMILKNNYTYLFELNQALLHYLCLHLNINKEIIITDQYNHHLSHDLMAQKFDIPLRNKINIESLNQKYYPQVFEDRYGFIPELSIIDLLFCMGPEASLLIQ